MGFTSPPPLVALPHGEVAAVRRLLLQDLHLLVKLHNTILYICADWLLVWHTVVDSEEARRRRARRTSCGSSSSRTGGFFSGAVKRAGRAGCLLCRGGSRRGWWPAGPPPRRPPTAASERRRLWLPEPLAMGPITPRFRRRKLKCCVTIVAHCWLTDENKIVCSNLILLLQRLHYPA